MCVCVCVCVYILHMFLCLACVYIQTCARARVCVQCILNVYIYKRDLSFLSLLRSLCFTTLSFPPPLFCFFHKMLIVRNQQQQTQSHPSVHISFL